MSELDSGAIKGALGVVGEDVDVIRSAFQRYFDNLAAGGDGFSTVSVDPGFPEQAL